MGQHIAEMGVGSRSRRERLIISPHPHPDFLLLCSRRRPARFPASLLLPGAGTREEKNNDINDLVYWSR
jgi:hypothetical protein